MEGCEVNPLRVKAYTSVCTSIWRERERENERDREEEEERFLLHQQKDDMGRKAPSPKYMA